MTRALLQSCANLFGCTSDAITGRCRSKYLVHARAAYAYVSRNRDEQSYPQIGRRLNRDHSSVIHLLRHIEKSKAAEPRVGEFIETHMARPKYDRAVFHVEVVNEKPEVVIEEPAPIVIPIEGADIECNDVGEDGRVTLKGLGTKFALDDNGFTEGDRMARTRIRRSTHALLAALQREHPMRCGGLAR